MGVLSPAESSRHTPPPEIMGAMTESRVLTYEATEGGATFLDRHGSLAESSASLPDGAYTTVRTYEGRRVLRLDRHIERLDESIALKGGQGALAPTVVRAAIHAVLDAAAWPESRLRLTFAPPRLFVAIEPFAPLPASAYQTGVACVTLALHRKIPHAKDTRFIRTASEAYGRLPAGVEEGLLVEDGWLLEGLSSNVFVVLGGVLRTEEERVLLGVTRSLVLEVAQDLVTIDRRGVTTAELARASEVFLTSVSREVLPVTRIDGRPVADGRVGPLTRWIMNRFAALVARDAEVL